MSDPLPPLPEPFAPTPRPLSSPGCSRGALIGCGLLILLFGVGAVAFTLNANRILVWVFQRLEAKVEARLPSDLTAAERERLSRSFADLYRTIEEGKVQPSSIQTLQRELFALSGDLERGLSREQVLRLVSAVEEAAAGAPAPAATPSPTGTVTARPG